MCCVFGGFALRYRKSKCMQVETGKQRFSLTEYDGGKRELQRIDQSRLQLLPYGGNTASDLDVLIARCLFRKSQRLFDSTGDKWKVVPPSITRGSRS